MPYSWVTPVTDRTSTSYYNFADPNRVDNNARYLLEYIQTNIGYALILDAYTTQDINSLPTNALINLLEHNINSIRDAIGDDPIIWATLNESWIGGDEFIYTDANNLESNLSALKTTLENIYLAFRRCGSFNCGTKLTIL